MNTPTPLQRITLRRHAGCDNIPAMPLTSLYLTPADATAAPAMATLRVILDQLEVVGNELPDGGLAAGTGFNRHIVFAGCSPHLPMHPPAPGSRAFCHVALHGPWERPLLITGANTVAPRCPECRHRFSTWKQSGATPPTGSTEIACPACGRVLTVCDLDWRGHAVCGRTLIEIRNVFPAEAMPSDQLLERLSGRTGMRWRFGWADALLD